MNNLTGKKSRLKDARAENYDALLVPGGVLNPDKMRMNKDCVEFAQHLMEAGKPVIRVVILNIFRIKLTVTLCSFQSKCDFSRLKYH